LLAAIRDPDPVLFLEPKRIYRLVKEEVENNGEALPLDVCFTLREGKDLTLVSWGAMLHETLSVADKLLTQGISCDVIDVATIKPLDMDTIIQSVEKTGRIVIVQEANPTCSVSADIAANLAERALTSLLAPVIRVTGYDVPMPLYRLEKLFIPSEERIMQAVKKVMEYA
jgi:pyruvate dehydrogenase E1 component beta subunit